MNQTVLNSTNTFTEGIRIISRPNDTDIGTVPLTPFVLSVSAETSNYEELSVSLYASNSRSIPYTSQLDNNWAKLKPRWRFLDSDQDYIDEYTDIDYHTEVVDENGKVRGGVGTITFYYVDDLPSDCGVPTMLHASLDLLPYYDRRFRGTSESITSFYNSDIKTIIPFYVYPLQPQFIHFTQNGNLDLYHLQWAGNEIKSYASIYGLPRTKFLEESTTAIDCPIIFDSPAYASDGSTNILSYTIYPLTGSELSGGPYTSEFEQHELSGGNVTGGWTLTTSVPMVENDGAILSGSVDIEYAPSAYVCETDTTMWLSNPKSNKLHNLQAIYMDYSNSTLIDFYETYGEYISDNVFNTAFSVPFYDPSDYTDDAEIIANPNELSGQSGIYGIGIDSGTNVWAVDFELDKIYKRDSAGKLLKTIDLTEPSALPIPYYFDEYVWYGPSSISIDRNDNAYVSLFNSPSAVKINSDGVIQHSFGPSGIPTPSGNEEAYYRGIDIETDISNNVHILYSNNQKAALYKYDGGGNLTYSWETSASYRPKDMIYVEDGGVESIYTVIEGTDTTPSGGIRRFELSASGYVEVSANICDAINPTYITVDKNKHIWFTFDDNKVGVLTDIYTTGQGSSFDSFEIPQNGYDIDVIGGICCDGSGFVNIVQQESNVLYRIKASTFIDTGTVDLYGIKILPEEDYITVIDGGEIVEIDASSNQPITSLQGYGDWTGLSRSLKYETSLSASELSGTTTDTLVGGSTPFQIKSFKSTYGLRRENDSWDMKDQIKSYILTDHQREFTDLWDDLIGNIVGNASSPYQTFGRQFYEKIANFVLNHGDVDLANIDQLYSLYDAFGLSYKNYNFNYPSELAHWMNILSIMFERLKGTSYPCNRNFKPQRYEKDEACEVCGQIHKSNMGDVISNPIMEVGTPVVLRDTFMSENAFDVFYPPMSGSYEQLDEYGFRSPFVSNYEVFEYISDPYANVQSEGFINWDDQYNELAISGIDSKDWWKSGGNVEEIFTQILFGGLDVGIEYVTELESANIFNINGNVLDNLSADNTSIVTPLTAESSQVIAVQNGEYELYTSYGVEYYTTSYTLTGESVDLINPFYISDGGLIQSNNYGKITIGSEVYYVPVHIVQERIITPIVGESVQFSDGIETIYNPLSSSGFFVVNVADGSKILFPVYQEVT